jgi:hypothetical protein
MHNVCIDAQSIMGESEIYQGAAENDKGQAQETFSNLGGEEATGENQELVGCFGSGDVYVC